MDSTEKPRTSRSSAVLPTGLRVGSRYVIESVIGEGAIGVVYLARREPEGDHVAIKVIHRHLCKDEQVFGRFRREAGILKRLQGQHLAQVFELFEDIGLLAIALEHIEGTSLEDVLKSTPPDLEQAIEITLQICAALGVAHAAGVIHRDLKPANVILERVRGNTRGLCVRVVDFGLTKIVCGEGAGQPAAALIERDMICGTPEYMAPEQVRGDEIDARADLYAAGVMLYELIVGHVPFHGPTPLATLEAHLHDEVPHPRASRSGQAISPALAAVMRRALAKDPGERYPSARAFAEALTAAWGERLVIAPRDSLHGAVTPEELATVDTELNLAEEARAAVKAAEEAAATSAATSSTARIETAKTIPGTVPAVKLAPEADPAGITLRSAVPSSEDSDKLRPSRPMPEIRIEMPPPRPSSRTFWIVAIVAAIICVIIGVWIGAR